VRTHLYGLRLQRPNKREAFVPAELSQLHPVDVNFGDDLQLVGVRLTRDAAGLTLSLRWRALKKLVRPWRCFGHVRADGERITSLDHEILRGHPPISAWQPGDEGFEQLRLWLEQPPAGLRIALGVYDAKINVRLPVLASTLPLEDEATAVLLEPDAVPEAAYTIQFDQPPLKPCQLVFEDGIELTAYSAARQCEFVCLRLKWIVRKGKRRVARFFGHAVEVPSPAAPTLAQFDQDFAVERSGPVSVVEQNIVRCLGTARPAWLRAGVCQPVNLVRLGILKGAIRLDQEERCAYLELAPGPLS
jgi:hypothetical protein